MEGVWEMMEKPCVECAIVRGPVENMLMCATFVVFSPVMLLVLTDDQHVSVNHYRTRQVAGPQNDEVLFIAHPFTFSF